MMELMMGPGKFMMGGWWIFPMLFCILMFLIFRFSGMGRQMPWSENTRSKETYRQNNDNDSALNILKMRLANGEITKSEFDEMKQTIS